MRNRRRKERKRNRGIRILIILLIVAGAVTAAAFIAWKAFVLETVDVVGNEIYSDEQIEEWVLNDEYSWNTLYVVLRNRFQKQDEIPFVDDMKVSMVSPTEIEVDVTEKGVLGYIYIPSLNQNAYFDQDGFVVELSDEAVHDVCQISGLDVETATLYDKLDLDNSSILKTLLSLTQLLKKYEIEPEVIYVQGSDLLLSYGSVQADLGNSSFLNEKVLRLSEILPQLSGSSGTLHLDTWSESSTDIYFSPDGQTAGSADEQTEVSIDEQPVSETEISEDDGEEE